MAKSKEVPRDKVASTIESVRAIEDIRFFLLTAPANWLGNQIIRRYCLSNNDGYVSCVRWNGLFFITGTDIVRCIMYKFQHFGRTITDRKKFEEGVFLDLRNLRVGNDAVLETPKLKFLDFLHKNQCIRTQKKQKVFFWFNVAHDKLMADALERDIKRERSGQSAVSTAVHEPALSFHYDSSSDCSLEEQLAAHLDLPRFKDARKLPLSATSSYARTPKYASVGSRPSLPVEPHKVVQKRPLEPCITEEFTMGEHVFEEPAIKKPCHEITDEDFPLDYLLRELTYPCATDGFGQDFTQPGYNLSPGFFSQSGLVPYLDSPINIVRNDDYIIEQSPLPKIANVPLQMLIPRLASDNHAFPLLAPSSAMPHLLSSYGTQFLLLASDTRTFDMFMPPLSSTSQTSSTEFLTKDLVQAEDEPGTPMNPGRDPANVPGGDFSKQEYDNMPTPESSAQSEI